jgi:hypothetical protein
MGVRKSRCIFFLFGTQIRALFSLSFLSIALDFSVYVNVYVIFFVEIATGKYKNSLDFFST